MQAQHQDMHTSRLLLLWCIVCVLNSKTHTYRPLFCFAFFLLLLLLVLLLLQLVLDAPPLERVSSQEFKKPDTPGRGVSRKGSLFRCNSIIDGHELDVSHDDDDDDDDWLISPTAV